MFGSASGSSSGIPVFGKGSVSVTVSPDGLEASMTIMAPPAGGSPIVLVEAQQALAGRNVVWGMIPGAVEALVEAAAGFGEGESATAVVARGVPPQPGQDAVVQIDDRLTLPGGTPAMKDDGSVDFFALGLVRNVAEGTVLIKKDPPTKGVNGMAVTGAQLSAPDGKDYVFKPAKGVRVTPDGLSLIAEVAGHAVMARDSTVSVLPIFEIMGDVDTSVGNIEFVGTVVVRGSIHSGFTVRAGQNVEVWGGIEGAVVEAGGDIIVRYGIQGASRGRVVAGGKIQCKFLENADVRCRRDLLVVDGILHSRVRSGGKIQLVGRRGAIMGGQVKAAEEIATRYLGTPQATLTEVEVGAAPELRDEYETCRKELAEAQENVRKSQQIVAALREQEAKQPTLFNEQKRQALMRTLRSMYHFQGLIEQYTARKAELEESLSSINSGRIRVLDTAYPGVRILIGNQHYLVVDDLQYVSFYLHQHEITLGSA
ncbi:MAG TPA: FapA family protein [Symbiobacteriaceae bacterium]|nr:FapA family protein [Symbiobacteriaceae bacterium]